MPASFSSIAHGLAGGVMIGCAAAAMLLFLGRIAGVSGLAAQAFWLSDQGSRLIDHAAFRRKRLNAENVIDSEKLERASSEKPASTFSQRPLALAFVIGLPAGAALAKLAGAPVEASFPSIPYLVLGGLLVGFGARLGSGCTSGHGVCGVSRLSKRSLVATAVFMATGMLTVAAMRASGALS
jgi:uncharacterized protein